MAGLENFIQQLGHTPHDPLETSRDLFGFENDVLKTAYQHSVFCKGCGRDILSVNLGANEYLSYKSIGFCPDCIRQQKNKLRYENRK